MLGGYSRLDMDSSRFEYEKGDKNNNIFLFIAQPTRQPRELKKKRNIYIHRRFAASIN